jgi:hypothetical protein
VPAHKPLNNPYRAQIMAWFALTRVASAPATAAWLTDDNLGGPNKDAACD